MVVGIIGQSKIDTDDIEKGWIGQGAALCPEIIPHVKAEPILPARKTKIVERRTATVYIGQA